MSIERQLTEAFKSHATELECPPALDARIRTEYERRMVEKRGTSLMNKKRALPRAAIIAVIVALICGFAYAGNKLLFSDSQGHYSVRTQTNEKFDLDLGTLEKVRTSLSEVQAQLAPGETAVVYLPELAAHPLGALPLGATNPKLVSDERQWRALLSESGVTKPLPESLLGGAYLFAAGTENNPFHITLGIHANEQWEEMKSEAAKSGGDRPLWRPADLSGWQPLSAYTSIYRDSDGESLYLTQEIVNGTSVHLEGLTPSNSDYTELDLQGNKAHYVKYDQSLYGDSSLFQYVMWIEADKDRTIVHRVESDSIGMTKDKLIEVANGLL